jgi:nicotinate-nucleotide--dimethylbenzimidazole phosphoribosyltransferase
MIQGTASSVGKSIIVAAGDHGVVKEGVSAYPPEVTPQMVHNFLRGGAGINVLARHVGARGVVVDAGVACELPSHPDLINEKIAPGTGNIAEGPAMTREEAVRSLEAGIRVAEAEIRKGADILGTGEMGIGNTTPSSAIVAVITETDIERVTGHGTGIDEKGREKKIQVIRKALATNAPDPTDGIDVLAKVGGCEIGVLAGVFLAGAAHRVPVVIDGFISAAAALIAYRLEPKARDFMIASHCSVEQGHKVALDFMGLKPLLDLHLRLGEGTGAALGISVVEAGVKILNEMATFTDAGISGKTEE